MATTTVVAIAISQIRTLNAFVATSSSWESFWTSGLFARNQANCRTGHRNAPIAARVAARPRLHAIADDLA